jgi:hypothetical protein
MHLIWVQCIWFCVQCIWHSDFLSPPIGGNVGNSKESHQGIISLHVMPCCQKAYTHAHNFVHLAMKSGPDSCSFALLRGRSVS